MCESKVWAEQLDPEWPVLETEKTVQQFGQEGGCSSGLALTFSMSVRHVHEDIQEADKFDSR